MTPSATRRACSAPSPRSLRRCRLGRPHVFCPSRMEQALWTGAVLGTMLHLVPGTDALSVAQALGRALARLHATPVGDYAPPAPRPWALAATTLPESMTGGATGANCRLVHQTLTDSQVARVLSTIAEAWSGTATWIHRGDLSGANILIHNVGRRAGAIHRLCRPRRRGHRQPQLGCGDSPRHLGSHGCPMGATAHRGG